MNAMQALAHRPSAVAHKTPAFIRFTAAAEAYRRAKDALLSTGGKKSPDVQLQLLELAAEAKLDEHRTASALDVSVQVVRGACRRWGVNLCDNETKVLTFSRVEPSDPAEASSAPKKRGRPNLKQARAKTQGLVRDHVLAHGEVPPKNWVAAKTGMSTVTVNKHWPSDEQIAHLEEEYLSMNDEDRPKVERAVYKLNRRGQEYYANEREILAVVTRLAFEQNAFYGRNGMMYGNFEMPTKKDVMLRSRRGYSVVNKFWPSEQQVRAAMDAELASRPSVEALEALGPDPFGDILAAARRSDDPRIQFAMTVHDALSPIYDEKPAETERETIERVCRSLYGEEFVEGVYMDADGAWASDRIVNDGEGFKPQVREWRNHVEDVSRIVFAYLEHSNA